MAYYEIVGTSVTLGLTFVLSFLTFQSQNKVLRLFFMFLVLFSIPLNISTALEIIKLNNVDNKLDNLATILTAGYSLSIFMLYTVGGYFMIMILIYVIQWFKNSFKVKQNKDIEDGDIEEVIR